MKNSEYSDCSAFPKDIKEANAEIAEIFDSFVFGDVIKENILDEKTRQTAVLASFIGCGAVKEFKIMLGKALYTVLPPR
ncbi:MAG: hypothetical protein LIO43_00855 [Clostridiales bacterium]|nr:hypothetical protein [Clostridiales bacterium]